MAQALFIDYTYFIANHPMFNGNIEQKTIEATILKAQRQYFGGVNTPLGTNLYNALISELISTSGNPSSNYATLLNDYIAPALVDWVAYKCVPYLSARFTNKGAVESSSDYSSPVSLEKLQMLKSEFELSAGALTQAVVDYLCQNNGLFPELNTNNGVDEKNPSNIGYKMPIYNPRNRGGRCGCKCQDECTHRIW